MADLVDKLRKNLKSLKARPHDSDLLQQNKALLLELRCYQRGLQTVRAKTATREH
jgi:hypothetical protein